MNYFADYAGGHIAFEGWLILVDKSIQRKVGLGLFDLADAPLRDYYLRHSASSSYFGANSINARLVTLQLREGVIVDSLPSELPDEDPQEETPESANPDTP